MPAVEWSETLVYSWSEVGQPSSAAIGEPGMASTHSSEPASVALGGDHAVMLLHPAGRCAALVVALVLCCLGAVFALVTSGEHAGGGCCLGDEVGNDVVKLAGAPPVLLVDSGTVAPALGDTDGAPCHVEHPTGDGLALLAA